MKQQWQRIALKIDALMLRERAIIFAMAALILIVLINTALLDPQFAKQKQLTQRIKKDQSVIAGLQAEIQQKMALQAQDPDKADKARLQQMKEQAAQMQDALLDTQKGLVPPDRMSALLEDILKQNAALHLVSLKTLSASPLTEQANAEVKPADGILSSIKEKVDGKAKDALGSPGVGSVYKHGVEIVVQGGYLDIMNYLTQLEAMPWQLLWSKAELKVDEYPRSTLTLTLFTLSLDKKWLNL
jgi:MSHA biogenesis protein MshJ